MKAQSSIETLLLIAGTLAFFVAVIPMVMQASDETTLSAEKIHHQGELDHIANAAKEADAYGPGTSFSLTARAKLDSQLSVGNGLATLSFQFNGKRITLNATTTKSAYTSLLLSKGPNDLVVENANGTVSIKAKH